MPADVPAPPRSTSKKPAFVAVTNGTVNKLLKDADGAGTATDTTNLFEASGRFGVGTASPQAGVHIFGPSNQDVFAGMGPNLAGTGIGFNFGYAGFTFGIGSGFFNVRPASGTAVAPNPSIRLMTANVQHIIIANNGVVGIGAKFRPANGSAGPGGSGAIPGAGSGQPNTVLDVDGDINMTGNINAKYQDVAEWVDASADLKAGTVVVLDASQNNKVMPSAHSYDTSVAGVVSERPGIVLGEAAANREKVATTGRVKVYVDATQAPIHIGDLLVTSDTPGMAMRSEPMTINGRSFHQPGTIIGKALEPMESGKGEILVLLTLQ